MYLCVVLFLLTVRGPPPTLPHEARGKGVVRVEPLLGGARLGPRDLHRAEYGFPFLCGAGEERGLHPFFQPHKPGGVREGVPVNEEKRREEKRRRDAYEK